MYRVITFFVLLLVSLSLAAAGNVAGELLEMNEAPTGGDFVLHSAKGDVDLKDFRGKVALLYFGYTKCPDVCPTSLAIMTQALNAFNEDELKQVQGLFISVDPARDDYAHLETYANYFHSNLMGITGSEEEVAQVAAQYGAQYYQVELEGSSFGYAVNHSSVIYLVTPEGVLRFVFPHNTPASVIVKAVRHVLGGQ